MKRDGLSHELIDEWLEWHVVPGIITDRENLKEYKTVTTALVIGQRYTNETGVHQIPTGLGYYSQWRTKELKPMYIDPDNGLGACGVYSPIHIASKWQLIYSSRSSEKSMQTFLQLLVMLSPGYQYWLGDNREQLLIDFPGGRAAIERIEKVVTDLETTYWPMYQRQRRREAV